MTIPYRYDTWQEQGYVGKRINVVPPITLPFVCPDCHESCEVISYIYYRGHQLWRGCLRCEFSAKERWVNPKVHKKLIQKFKKEKHEPESLFDLSQFKQEKKGYNADTW